MVATLSERLNELLDFDEHKMSTEQDMPSGTTTVAEEEHDFDSLLQRCIAYEDQMNQYKEQCNELKRLNNELQEQINFYNSKETEEPFEDSIMIEDENEV